MNRYLELVETYGADHQRVRDFLNEHRNEPEIWAWVEVVGELDRKGRASRRRPAVPPRLARLVRAAAVVLLVLTGWFGANAYVKHDQIETALDAARTDAELTRTALTNTQTKLEVARANSEAATARAVKAEEKVASLATADRTIAELREEVKSARDKYQEVKEKVAIAEHKFRESEAAWAEKFDERSKALAAAQKAEQDVRRDREEYRVQLNAARLALQLLKDTGDGKNPERTAVVILACSRFASGDAYMPWRRQDAPRFLPEGVKGTPGLNYGRATLFHIAGDQTAYESHLMKATQDPIWSSLASTEARAGKNPVELIQVVSDLTHKIHSGNPREPNPVQISLQMVQRETALRSFSRAYLLLKSEEEQARSLRPLREKAAQRGLPDAERVAAIDMLGAIGWHLTDDREAVTALATGLRDKAPVVRWHAARALAEFGPEAAARVRDDLLRLRNDEDEGVREQARKALRRIDPRFAPDR